jgi:hypothetical protein
MERFVFFYTGVKDVTHIYTPETLHQWRQWWTDFNEIIWCEPSLKYRHETISAMLDTVRFIHNKFSNSKATILCLESSKITDTVPVLIHVQ